MSNAASAMNPPPRSSTNYSAPGSTPGPNDGLDAAACCGPSTARGSDPQRPCRLAGGSDRRAAPGRTRAAECWRRAWPPSAEEPRAADVEAAFAAAQIIGRTDLTTLRPDPPRKDECRARIRRLVPRPQTTGPSTKSRNPYAAAKNMGRFSPPLRAGLNDSAQSMNTADCSTPVSGRPEIPADLHSPAGVDRGPCGSGRRPPHRGPAAGVLLML